MPTVDSEVSDLPMEVDIRGLRPVSVYRLGAEECRLLAGRHSTDDPSHDVRADLPPDHGNARELNLGLQPAGE